MTRREIERVATILSKPVGLKWMEPMSTSRAQSEVDRGAVIPR